MQNHTMRKKMLKIVLFLTICFRVISVDARPMAVKGQPGSTSQIRTAASRRGQQRSRGAQQRSPQGRYAAGARQQPGRSANTQTPATRVPAVVPVVVPAPVEQQPVPTNVGINTARWRAIQKILLSKKASPSEALEIVKKIRTKDLTNEQEEWLSMFEEWMVLALLQKSGQLVGTSSVEKISQQGGLLEQPATPASDIIDAKKWEQIKEFLNGKMETGSSSKALEYIKYIKEKSLTLTDEQQIWLNEFEQKVKRAEIALQQAPVVKPTQTSQQGSQTVLGQLLGSVPNIYSATGGGDPSLVNPGAQVVSEPQLSSAPVTGDGPSAIVTVKESSKTQQPPVAQLQVTPVSNTQAPQTALGQLWEYVPSPYGFVGVYDPNLRYPKSTAPIQPAEPQLSSAPVAGGGPSAIVEEPKPTTQVPAVQPRQQGPQTALGQLWEYVPSPYALVGVHDPNLTSATTVQASAVKPQPGQHSTEEGWTKLQDDLTREAKNPSPLLIERIEKIKTYPYFNDKQRNWLNKFQQNIQQNLKDVIHKSEGTLREKSWKNLQGTFIKAAAWPSQNLVEEIEKVKKSPLFSNEQQEWLEKFQQTIKELLQKQAELSTQAVPVV